MANQNTLLIFVPSNNESPIVSYATFDARNNRLVLDFDGNTNESAIFTGILPKQYSGNGVTVYIHYAMSTDISGTVEWEVQFERIGDGVLDIDSDSFATAQSTGLVTVPGTSGHVDIASIAFTDGAQMDALVAGEAFRIKVTRDAVNDSASNDAELLAVEIRET